MFACVYFHAQQEKGEEGEKVRYWRPASEQDGGSTECSVIFFCIRICVFVVARSTVILIVCTAKKKERERRGKKRTTSKSTYIHTAAKHIGQLRPMAETHACREHHPVKR
jgi:hypothetical protein